MSEQTRKTASFQFKEMDWNAYTRYRCPYSEAMYEIIFNHHAKSGGKLERALDLGSGNGVVCKHLAEQFSQVVYSDVNADYVEQARERFGSSLGNSKMSYIQASWDNLTDQPSLVKAPVDMVTAGTALHWITDAGHAMSQIASVLVPGGTFAGFSYGVRGFFDESDPIHPIFERIFQVLLKAYTSGVEADSTQSGPAKWCSRYDFLPFDEKLWKNVTRFTSLPQESMVAASIQPTPSRATDAEARQVLADDFFHVNADFDWIKNYFINMWPALDLAQKASTDFDEMQKTMGDRVVKLNFPMILVIATRR